jgi:type II secretion system protein H
VERAPARTSRGDFMVSNRTSASKCFTVLEVLIALAIIGMLAAIVVAPMSSHMRGAEVEGAAARVQTALSDAQTEARESGRPVTVIAVVGEDGRTGLASRMVSAPATDQAPAAPGMEHAFARATRQVNLPQGVTIAGSERPVETARSIGGMAAPARNGATDSGDPQERTLAVFLPDGSAVVAGPIRVCGKDGRTSEVRVNPWTGVAALGGVTNEDRGTRDAAAPAPLRADEFSDDADPFAKWR